MTTVTSLSHSPSRLMPTKMAPILVVDDDAKILQLVRAYLKREGFAVITASDGRSALAAVRESHPRLVILDVMLPELDGIAVLRAVRESSNIPILMLSARGGTADRIYGIDGGADDYLANPFPPAELVVRVKAILRRAETMTSARRGELRHSDLVIDLDRHEVRRGTDRIALSDAEFRLLVALVEAGGRVLSREFLLDTLHGAGESDALDRTVDVYVGRLREKLGDNAERPRYVAPGRGAGYPAARE